MGKGITLQRIMHTNKLWIEFDPIDLDVPVETLGSEEETKRWIWENCGALFVAKMKLSQNSGSNKAEAELLSTSPVQQSTQVKLETKIKHLEAENFRLRENETISLKAASSQLRYFACMSHEIRTPLSCIIGLSKMLVDMNLGPQQEEYMKMIVSSSDLLLAVVNDVLDWSKLETGSYSVLVRESSLQEVLDSTVRSIQMQAQAKQIRLATFYDSSVPEKFTTDSRRLQQILYNLLGNAIKFSEEGGVVKLSVTIVDNPSTDGLLQTLAEEEQETGLPEVKSGKGLTLTEAMFSNLWTRSSQESLRLLSALSSSSLSDIIDESMAESSVSSGTASRYHNTISSFLHQSSQTPSIRFEITDFGIGIKEEDIDRIFLPYHQESPETESIFGGTGLGLTITYKLVKALGGSIKVESKVGEFTRFTVDLPFADNPVDFRSAALPDTKVLLIIEPEDASYAVALHTFTEYGISFDVLPNLAAAVENLCEKGVEATADNFICLFHEDLFQADWAEQLKERNIPLVSFGPRHTVQTVDTHIMSLEQILPSVLVKSLHNSMLQKTDSRMSPQSPASLIPKSGISANAKNLRILIAEDNAINQKILSQMLIRLGLRDVDIVDNGEQAIEKESTNRYDLIFMDALMPKVDGVQACKAIQRRQRHAGGHPTPYIVFVTAYISTEFNKNCHIAGGDEVLTKPYNVEEICASMARAAATRDRASISSVITAL